MNPGNEVDAEKARLVTRNDNNYSSLEADLDDHKSISDDFLLGLTEESSAASRYYVLACQAGPIVLSFVLIQMLPAFINLVFAGHYGDSDSNGENDSVIFAGISLANMFAIMSLQSILVGMSTAVETLGSQNNGAGNYKEVGIVLQRAYVILGLLSTPIAISWFFADDLFAAIGVDSNVCIVIRNYLRVRVLTVPADIQVESYIKYLMSIGVVQPSFWFGVVFNVSLLLFNSIFVYVFHLDYECLAWAWVFSVYIAAFIQITLSRQYTAVTRTLQPWDRKALKKWWEFIELGAPGTAMMCSEWWAYEVLIVFASFLGTENVGANTIVMQTCNLAFMVPLGICIATTSLIGNSLGASKKSLAIQIGKDSLIAIAISEVFVGLLIYFFGAAFCRIYTNDAVVIDIAVRSIPFLAVYCMVDGIQGVASGILRGCGQQFVGAMCNIVAFYLFGLPMAWYVCFHLGLGVPGLMLGFVAGPIVQSTVLLILILRYEEFLYGDSSVATNQDALVRDTHMVLQRRNSLGIDKDHTVVIPPSPRLSRF